MLSEQRRSQLDEIVKKMAVNKEDDSTIQFVVDDFKKKYENETVSQVNNKSLITKLGETSDKIMNTAANVTGIKSGIDLLFTAAKGAEYGMNKLLGNEKANEQLLKMPKTEIEQAAEQGGTMAGVKNIAGKSLEVAASAAPFAKGIGLSLKTPELIKTFAIKFPTLARYTGYAVTGGSYGGSFGASNALQENKKIMPEIVKGVATGALIGVAVPAIVEGTVRAVKNVASLYSGVPNKALENAFNNPEKVQATVRKYAQNPEQKQDILVKANEAFDSIKKARADAYQGALNELKDDVFVTQTGVNKGQMYIRNPKTDVFEPTKLTTKGVKDELSKTLKNFNTKILEKSEQNKINELQDMIYQWDDFSPIGLNDLKKAVFNRKNMSNSNEYNAIITRVGENLKNYVNTRVPQIAEMNAQYTASSQFIENLQKEIFGKTKSMSDSTKLNRLLSVFSQKSELREQLIKELGEKAGVDLINEITGAAMTSWLPTGWVQRFILGGTGAGVGISAVANPAVIPGALVGALGASPRIVSKGARVLGQLNRIIPPAAKKLQAIITKQAVK